VYDELAFSLIAISIAPLLFVLGYSFHVADQKDSGQVRKQGKERVSVGTRGDEFCPRGLRPFAREILKKYRGRSAKLENVETALKRRSPKRQKLPPLSTSRFHRTCCLAYGARWRSAGESTLRGPACDRFFCIGHEIDKRCGNYPTMTALGFRKPSWYESIQEVLEIERVSKISPCPKRVRAFIGKKNLVRDVTFVTTNRPPVLKNQASRLRREVAAGSSAHPERDKTTTIQA